jgi:hypothetical protein
VPVDGGEAIAGFATVSDCCDKLLGCAETLLRDEKRVEKAIADNATTSTNPAARLRRVGSVKERRIKSALWYLKLKLHNGEY